MIKSNKQILCIKNIFYDIQSITVPAVGGFNHAVYIVKTKDKKYICRFSNPETAKHNFNVSKLLLANDINVPDVSVHKFEDVCCETYPFVEGKTLYERTQEGISDKEKDKIYEQLFDLLCKIASLKCDSKSISSHEGILAKILQKVFGIMNPYGQKTLTHVDLNTQNILLDKDDNVCALLDLDSVDKRDFSFGFISMMSRAKSADYIPKGLIEKHKALHPKSRISLQKQIQIYNWLIHFYVNYIRKHMLKGHTK